MTERKDDPMALWTGTWGRRARRTGEVESSPASEPTERSDDPETPEDRPEGSRSRRLKPDR